MSDSNAEIKSTEIVSGVQNNGTLCKECKKINIIIDGVEVEGDILHHGARDFQIQITSPFMNLSGGSHIPYFAPRVHTFHGEYGEMRMNQTLAQLYGIGKFLAENQEELTRKYQIVKKEIEEIKKNGLSYDEFKAKRIELRKQMRKGEITSKQYQKLLTPLRKKYEEVDLNVSLKIFFFHQDNFPMTVSIDTDSEIIDILEGVKKLSKEGG